MTSRWDEIYNRKSSPPPPPPPVDPINGVRKHSYARHALEDECAAVAATPEGSRNPRLNIAGFSLGTLVGAGALDEDEVTERLHAAGLACGLDWPEVRKTVASGVSAGMKHPRQLPESVSEPRAAGATPEWGEPTILGPVPGWSSANRAGGNDGSQDIVDDSTILWEQRPTLAHVYAFAKARRTSPWAVLGVVLCRVVTATPPTMVLPAIIGTAASLNQFVALVGTSGAGKGAAMGVAAEAVHTGLLTVIKTGSGEGIAHGYMRRTKEGIEQHTEQILFEIPEIDTLTALGNRQGATLLPELRSAWSGEQLGFGYADPTKRLPVPAGKYRLCLVAGVQPSRAGGLLGDAGAGTPQRFLWLPATDPDAPDEAPVAPAPMVWIAPSWGKLLMAGPRTVSGHLMMTVCDEARSTIVAAHLARTRGQGDALDGHALLARLKAAAALALLESRVDVNEQDWWLSGLIAAKSDATRAGVAAVLADADRAANRGKALAEADRSIIVSEKLEEDAVRRVCRLIVRKLTKEADWTAGGVLRRTVPQRDRGYLETALEKLLDVGQIEAQTTSHGVQYRCPP